MHARAWASAERKNGEGGVFLLLLFFSRKGLIPPYVSYVLQFGHNAPLSLMERYNWG